jgi:plasmid stabilization system protein ParE
VKQVEFAPEARAELDAAADHYEQERSGRGARFYVAVERAVKLIAAFPAAGHPFPGIRPELH